MWERREGVGGVRVWAMLMWKGEELFESSSKVFLSPESNDSDCCEADVRV